MHRTYVYSLGGTGAVTVMTAIVVIALLAVFREQVINAVQNAFQSVTGAG